MHPLLVFIIPLVGFLAQPWIQTWCGYSEQWRDSLTQAYQERIPAKTTPSTSISGAVTDTLPLNTPSEDDFLKWTFTVFITGAILGLAIFATRVLSATRQIDTRGESPSRCSQKETTGHCPLTNSLTLADDLLTRTPKGRVLGKKACREEARIREEELLWFLIRENSTCPL
jgi:hypothetical protein